MTKAKNERKQKLSQSDRLKSMTKSNKNKRRMLRPVNKPIRNGIHGLNMKENDMSKMT